MSRGAVSWGGFFAQIKSGVSPSRVMEPFDLARRTVLQT